MAAVNDRSERIPGRDAFIAEARRLSAALSMRHPPDGKKGCLRKCLNSLYRAMAPKRDGSHPLDRDDPEHGAA